MLLLLLLLINTYVPAPLLNHNYPEGQNHYEGDTLKSDGKINFFISHHVFTDAYNLCGSLLTYSSIVYMHCDFLYLKPCNTAAYNRKFEYRQRMTGCMYPPLSPIFNKEQKLKSLSSQRDTD